MREELINGASAVGRHWVLILALGLVNVLLSSVLLRLVLSPELAPVVLVVVASLSIVVHAKVAGEVRGGTPEPYIEALRTYGLNFLLVVVVLGAPGFLVRSIVTASIHASLAQVAIDLGVRILTGMLLLYALPLVFYRQQGFGAIRSGIRFLANRKPDGSTLIGLLTIANFIEALGVTVLHHSSGSWLLFLGTSLVVGGTYGSVLVFAIACAFIIRDQRTSQQAIA